MSSAVDDTDVTVQLPDEVLCHIISSLSLSQKLRLESVNHKFQRCIQLELKANPQPLELDLYYRKLNGHDRLFRYSYNASGQFSGALETLAKKAKFTSIWVRVGVVFERESMEKLDRALSLLIAEHRCLTKVTSFRSDSGCTQAVLENFLDKCGKLSSIRFDCNIRPLNTGSIRGYSTSFPMDMHQVLKNRGLTELALRPFEYPQKGLTDMLQGILPNTLRKLDLCFTGTPRAPELNIAQLVNALGPNWSVLEKICLKFQYSVAPRDLLVHLFESLSRLPALRKCDMEFFEIGPENQFMASMTSLLALSDINITVTTIASRPFFMDVPGCQAETMIRQVRDVYPGLVVDFDRAGSLVLKLSNARWVLEDLLEIIEPCGAEDCVQCQSFYPSLLSLLLSRAREASLGDVEALHLPNWHLDRCRVHRVVADLNGPDDYDYDEDMGPFWRAASVVANKQQQTVTVNFETKWDRHPFLSVTVRYGHCLTNGCTKCG